MIFTLSGRTMLSMFLQSAKAEFLIVVTPSGTIKEARLVQFRNALPFIVVTPEAVTVVSAEHPSKVLESIFVTLAGIEIS